MLSLEELQKYRSETICRDAVIWMHGNQYSRSARSRHLDEDSSLNASNFRCFYLRTLEGTYPPISMNEFQKFNLEVNHSIINVDDLILAPKPCLKMATFCGRIDNGEMAESVLRNL